MGGGVASSAGRGLLFISGMNERPGSPARPSAGSRRGADHTSFALGELSGRGRARSRRAGRSSTTVPQPPSTTLAAARAATSNGS